jgi:hypothetical protein
VALASFCESLAAAELRTLAMSALLAMREVNQPTVETLQLLIIDEIEAALKATRKARRTEDSDSIESAMDAQEEHAAGAFTDASLAHCLPTCSWFSIVGARRPNPCCMHVS